MVDSRWSITLTFDHRPSTNTKPVVFTTEMRKFAACFGLKVLAPHFCSPLSRFHLAMRDIHTLPLPMRLACFASGSLLWMLLALSLPSYASNRVASNKFIGVEMDEHLGFFYIYNTFPGNSSALILPNGYSSFVNFRFHIGNSNKDTMFTNASDPRFAPHCGHLAPDSTRLRLGVGGAPDTCVAYFTKFGIMVQTRLTPFITPNGDAGQVMIEFMTKKIDPATSAALTGILWQNDVAVTGDPSTNCGTSGDHPVILTSSHFDARPKALTTFCWTGQMASYANTPGAIPPFPDYYHVAQGFPNYTCPACGFGYGKLQGAGLTTPDEFYIGDWGSSDSGLHSVDWDVYGPHLISNGADYVDAAVIYKWICYNPARLATIYGQDDTVNDLKICPGIIFKEVSFPLVIQRDSLTGLYNPHPYNITLYLINVGRDGYTATIPGVNVDLTAANHLYFSGMATSLRSNVFSLPNGATDLGDNVGLKLVIPLEVDSTTFLSKGIVDKQTVNMQVVVQNAVQMKDDGAICPVNLTVIGEGLPPKDTVAPKVAAITQTRYQSSFTTLDNRNHDKGVNTITPSNTTVNNYLVTNTAFTPCDTSQRITITAKVVDTTLPACVDIHVKDCAGNDSMFNVCYSPRLDTVPPVITQLDSSGKDGSAPNCNNRCHTFLVEDNKVTDYGMQSITAASLVNFTPLVVDSGRPVQAHNKADTFQTCVVDPLRNGQIVVVTKDFMGNTTTQTIDYCSVPDAHPPAISISRDPNKKLVTVKVTETSPWDRGLSRVYVDLAASLNVKTTPTTIVWTRDSSTFTIEPVDTLQPSNFSVCAQDSFFAPTLPPADKAAYFTQTNADHELCVTGSFSGEDTLAPNVIITPLSGTSARVEINDIHIIGGTAYPLDMGIQSVVLDTHNVVIDSAYVLGSCDTKIMFRFKVRDTLAFCDTIAYANISAIDCRFNTSTIAKWKYTVRPDTLSPIISSTVDPNGVIHVDVSDSRNYDRGLGSVVLTSPVNITPHNSVASDGRSTESFTIDIIDRTLDASATLTVTDRWGASCNLPLKGTHTQTIPFTYSGAPLKLSQASIVEDAIGTLTLSRVGSLDGKNINTIDFDLVFDSLTLDYRSYNAGSFNLTPTNNPATSGRVHINLVSVGGPFTNAMTLPTFDFKALYLKPGMDSKVITVMVQNIVVNGGSTTKVTSADGSSFLLEPPGVITVQPGNVTVSKTCDRTGSSSAFSLTQNFPNPFWDHAQVQYVLPGNGHVRMTIYDVLGMEVATVVDADQTQGTHTVQLSSANMKPGTYFYKLRALCTSCVQEFVSVKRMVVAR